MTQYGLKSLCPTYNSFAYTIYCTIPTRPATPPLQPIQEEVLPEPEQMDIKIMDDQPGSINVPEELFSDFDSWVQTVLKYQC